MGPLFVHIQGFRPHFAKSLLVVVRSQARRCCSCGPRVLVAIRKHQLGGPRGIIVGRGVCPPASLSNPSHMITRPASALELERMCSPMLPFEDWSAPLRYPVALLALLKRKSAPTSLALSMSCMLNGVLYLGMSSLVENVGANLSLPVLCMLTGVQRRLQSFHGSRPGVGSRVQPHAACGRARRITRCACAWASRRSVRRRFHLAQHCCSAQHCCT